MNQPTKLIWPENKFPDISYRDLYNKPVNLNHIMLVCVQKLNKIYCAERFAKGFAILTLRVPIER